MPPLISIIMPVYNAEKTLNRAIDSIISQTMIEWELILVDDGSTDDSPSICDKYKIIDDRIVVIHKKNAGVAAARQDGLDTTQGEYVIHADSDDWMDNNALAELYSTAIKHDADVVLCDYILQVDETGTYVKQTPSNVYDNRQIIRDLPRNLLGVLWNKLVRRSVIDKFDVKFMSGIDYSEDLLFCYQLFVNPVKCVYLSAAFYHYVMRQTSITHLISRKNIDFRLMAYEQMKTILDNNIYKKDLHKFKFYVLIEALKSGLYNAEEISLMYKECSFITCLRFGFGKKQKLAAVLMAVGLSDYAIKLYHNNYINNKRH